PLWLLMAPFALLLAPALRLAPEGRQVRPYRAAWALGGMLMALSGTLVHVETPAALIHIRIL
ncbi:MAG: hypothetical protein ACREEQ_10750, partial [Caulobacteraceae bacterium]